MDLKNFSRFSEAIQVLNEQSNAYPINEAIKSSILKDLSNMRGFKGWRGSFFKDFYSNLKIDLNELGDNYFTTISADEAKKSMKRKENKMIFVCYDPTLDPNFDRANKKSVAGVAITLRGSALYSGFKGGSGSGKMGLDKWDRKYYMGQWDKLGNFSPKTLSEIGNTFYSLDVEAAQAALSTTDKIETRKSQKQGSAAELTDRQIRNMNQARYKALLADKVDPKSVMTMAMEVAQIVFGKLIESSSGTPEEFADSFMKEQRWDGWSRNLGSIMSSLGQQLERYARDYSQYLKAAQEVAKEKKEDGDSEYFYGKYRLQNMKDRFADYKAQVAKLKTQASQL